ncbi:unnamed protein product [Diabrotica balteata]|uniref:SH2 domain-containing protein n=1 Tax=Diabrotica balteata TaxID=107213 RepID=A0A9N9T8C5_DIABA|nr:unnamed protein product [Diabrotica balteata]
MYGVAGEDVNHTFGPLDGSIYATIAKKPELSPGAVSSPLTVSMDSGISSAGHHPPNANTTTSSGSPPLTAQPSPLTPEDQHRELDELLSDMMLTVQSIPDLKPSPTSSINVREEDNFRFIDDEEERGHHPPNANTTTSSGSPPLTAQPSPLTPEDQHRELDELLSDMMLTVQSIPDLKPSPTSSINVREEDNFRFIDDEEERGIPYHARQTSQPFSQSLQPIKRDFREEYYREDVRRYDPLKRSLTEGTIRRSPEKIYKQSQSLVNSPYSDSESLSPPGAFRNNTKSPEFHETYANSSNLTWLQRQQQKLKERRELILREERQPHETRLLSELRSIQSRHMRPTASHRLDAFADDDEDYTIPLHINTMHKNGTSTPGSNSTYSTLKSTYSTSVKNERPFVSVKRAHERYAQNGNQSPAQILAANPLGHVVRPPSRSTDQVDSGLLSLAEKQQYKTNYSKQQQTVGIESETDSSPTAEERLPRPPTDGKPSVDHRSPIDREQPVGQRQLVDRGERSEDRSDGRPPVDGARLEALNDLIANLSSGSDKSNESPNNVAPAWQYQREESIQSWRSQTGTELDSSPSHNSSPRPQTPAFPVHARTPYINASTPTVQFDIPSERLPPKSPTTQRKDRPTSPSDLTNGSAEYTHTITSRSISATPTSGFRDTTDNYQHSPKSPSYNGSSSPTVYYGTSRRSSINSNNESPHEVSAANVKFVRDTSKFWYKPSITREQAIIMLREQQPGTFVVRDSNSFPGAFGLALRVATVPSNVQNKSGSSDDLIRHFLIEPTSRGVRLKGCQNEPVFSSLSALIYQHSITQMALPCRLILPHEDLRRFYNSKQLFNVDRGRSSKNTIRTRPESSC